MHTAATSDRPKVLASVYACEPGGGSEEGCGWNYILQLSKFAEVWAVTRPFHAASIEGFLRTNKLPNVHWHYYDFGWPDAWHSSKRFERIHYNLWQYMMYRRVAKPLHETVGFDVTHHLTWGQYWSASHLWRLSSRFVWGPVGGGESAPASFKSTFSLSGKIYESTRDLARGFGHLRPSVRSQAKHAYIALGATPETAAEMKKLGASDVSVLPNAALPSADFDLLSKLRSESVEPFRVISIGRLLHWKGFHIGLRAFAKFVKECPGAEYWIIGTGPDSDRLKKLAVELGVADSVRFWGRIARQEVLQKLAQCSVMLHPSLHDSSGWVPLEAGASGLPIVCLNIGGPAQLVTESTGIKVDAITPDQAIEDLSSALCNLYMNPNLYKQMSEASREHIRTTFLWDHVGEYFRKSEAYQIDQNDGWTVNQSEYTSASPNVRSQL